MTATPNIVIIGTGGTIAGQARSATDLAYEAAKLSVEDLLEAVPGLENVAQISAQSLFSLNSKDMGPAEWQRLAGRTSEVLRDPGISGVVITHGTDTLEEAALFLHLTVRSDKPVVLTGSMRPATALSADGPANLYQAVQVCASQEAVGRGVMVVMNGEIWPARHVVKRHSIATSSFAAYPGGALGSVYPGHTFFASPPGLPQMSGEFEELTRLEMEIPEVAVHYPVASGDPRSLAGSITADCRGLVIAAYGCGEIPELLLPVIEQTAARGICVVVSSRIAGVAVMPETMTLQEADNVIASGHLNPQKSALLLALGLAAGLRPRNVFTNFGTEG
ncbi:MAG: L-asparaginase 2 [Pseudomonadota bacterium]|nr:MAG: L-asparaginase 2 [Pseudomonadota bacterium]